MTLPNEVTSSYAYDDAGRLTLLTHDNITGTLASYDYSLDAVGNRRVLTESLVTVQNLPGGAYLEENGQVVMEAENGDITNGASHTWLRLTTQSGTFGRHQLRPNVAGYRCSLPNQ